MARPQAPPNQADSVRRASAPVRDPGGRREWWPPVAVAALVVALCAVHLWWLHRFRDGFPVNIDEARYLDFALALRDSLAGGPGELWDTWQSQRDFGPLLPLTSVPFLAFGRDLITGIATQLVFFAVLVVATYGIGARLSSRSGGLLAAAVVAATPAVIDFTRTYEFAVTAGAMLAATTYALLASEAFSRRGWALAWGVLLGLTALSRTMVIAFLAGQVLVALLLVLGRPGDRRTRVVNLATAAGAALLAAAVWFAISFRSVWNYLTDLGYGSQSAEFGTTGSRTSLDYWAGELEEAIRDDLYLPLALVLVLVLLAALAGLVARRRARSGAGSWREAGRNFAVSDAGALVILLLEGYLALTSSRNQGVGFRVPLYPLTAALAVAALWRIPWRGARVALTCALVAVVILNTVMKADWVDTVSERRDVDLPRVGNTPVTEGLGYIQGYVVGALEAPRPGPTEPLADATRGWLPAYSDIGRSLQPLAEALGREPVVSLATYEPLMNPFALAMAARLDLRRALPVNGLAAPEGAADAASYRRILTDAAPDALVTVSRIGVSYPVLTGGRSLDQALLERVAKDLGYARRATVPLPNLRAANIAWRSEAHQ